MSSSVYFARRYKQKLFLYNSHISQYLPSFSSSYTTTVSFNIISLLCRRLLTLINQPTLLNFTMKLFPAVLSAVGLLALASADVTVYETQTSIIVKDMVSTINVCVLQCSRSPQLTFISKNYEFVTVPTSWPSFPASIDFPNTSGAVASASGEMNATLPSASGKRFCPIFDQKY